MSAITTHVLDTALGRPAGGVRSGSSSVDGDRPSSPRPRPTTTAGSRDLGPDRVEPGHLPSWSSTSRRTPTATGQACFFPEVGLTFALTDGRAPPRPTAAQPVRLFHLPRELIPMAIRLGPNQYGKAENRVVRIYRDTAAPPDPRPERLDRPARRASRTRTSPATRATYCRPTPRRTPSSPSPRRRASTRSRSSPSPSADHFIDATPAADGARSRSRSTPGTGSRSTAPATTTRSSAPAAASAPPSSTSTVAARTARRTSSPGSRTSSS